MQRLTEWPNGGKTIRYQCTCNLIHLQPVNTELSLSDGGVVWSHCLASRLVVLLLAGRGGEGGEGDSTSQGPSLSTGYELKALETHCAIPAQRQ